MYIGIDIGGTKCAVTKADEEGIILEKIRFETVGKEETLTKIFDAAEKLGSAKSIGISCGGPLDSRRGIIMSPPNLPGWDMVHIVDMLTERFGIPAYLQNDANACALAEWKFGAGRGCRNMIFLTFGTGMGAGLILNGRLYEGTNGNAGEAGHIRLDTNGPVGFGKCGSFEGFCSGGGIAQLAKIKATELLQTGRKSSFCESFSEINGINAKKVAECALQGFDDAKEVYCRCGEYLGKALSIFVDLLNPERIVMGSIYARSGELLQKSMMEVMEKECLETSLSVCRIVPAQLGEEIGDIAAISVAMSGEKEEL